MPFEARVFSSLSTAEWTASDDQRARRDIYLMGKSDAWRDVGIKLRDVPVAQSSSSSSAVAVSANDHLFQGTLRCKLEIKERGTGKETKPGVELWTKILKQHGAFALRDIRAILDCGVASNGQLARSVCAQVDDDASLMWIVVDKVVAKESTRLGERETSLVRVTLLPSSLDGHKGERQVSVWKTMSMEAFAPQGPEAFLVEMAKSAPMVVAGYPEFLQTLVSKYPTLSVEAPPSLVINVKECKVTCPFCRETVDVEDALAWDDYVNYPMLWHCSKAVLDPKAFERVTRAWDKTPDDTCDDSAPTTVSVPLLYIERMADSFMSDWISERELTPAEMGELTRSYDYKKFRDGYDPAVAARLGVVRAKKNTNYESLDAQARARLMNISVPVESYQLKQDWSDHAYAHVDPRHDGVYVFLRVRELSDKTTSVIKFWGD
jgi:hypothetical protein